MSNVTDYDRIVLYRSNFPLPKDRNNYQIGINAGRVLGSRSDFWMVRPPRDYTNVFMLRKNSDCIVLPFEER